MANPSIKERAEIAIGQLLSRLYILREEIAFQVKYIHETSKMLWEDKQEIDRKRMQKFLSKSKTKELTGNYNALSLAEKILDNLPSLEGTESYFTGISKAMIEFLEFHGVDKDRPVYEKVKALPQPAQRPIDEEAQRQAVENIVKQANEALDQEGKNEQN